MSHLLRLMLATTVALGVACGDETPTPVKKMPTQCVDLDHDGYGTGCTTTGADCNDADADNWISCSACVDTDSDGYFVGCDAYTNHNGPDCNDSLAACTSDCSSAQCGGCTDADADGHCADADCNDADANNWTSCDTCVDTDSDTYFVGCDAYTTINGPDCDDTLIACNTDCTLVQCLPCTDDDDDGYCVDDDCDDVDVNNWDSCDTCVDVDEDTYFVGCDAYTAINGPDCDDDASACTTDCSSCGCTDVDMDGWCADVDCDDDDGNNWISCNDCVDGDDDSYFVGCDAYDTIDGPDCDDELMACTTDCSSVECGGACTDDDEDGHCVDADCDDGDVNNWVSCDTCVDTDSDTYFVGCDAYATLNGPDCDDALQACTTDCSQPQCCTDADSDGHCVGDDCNDDDVNNWVSCDNCVDADNDSYFIGCDAYVTIDGPDCFDQNGTCTDTCDTSCCTWVKGDYSWFDISSTGTDLGIGRCDDCNTDATLGFSFPYFGQSFDTVSVNTNGGLILGAGNYLSTTNTAIPNQATPDNVIAPFWDDLSASMYGSTYIRSQTIPGTVDRFVVTWQDTAFFANRDSEMTFQIILGADGDIQFQYAANSDPSDTQTHAAEATIGVESGTGAETIGVPYSHNEPVLDGDPLEWGSANLQLMCPAN